MDFEKLFKKDKYQVFLFSCPASLPLSFAQHPWLVINNKGVLSRWEVFWRPDQGKPSWGHVHKNFYKPTQGLPIFPFVSKVFWSNVRLIGCIESDESGTAKKMLDFIDASPEKYLYCYKYSFLGPNSITYVQWILNNFPKSGLTLKWKAFGKGFV